MKTNIFDKIEALSYSCPVLFLSVFLKTKYVEFTNLKKMKLKT